ncbi:MAG: leucyl/phenylalanyl-tRNA--protein transferase [Myxococcales bacterium FL481]|nr:MAG: leucyl/phenylalanyl-tRNA--protein transferase [Myxococcales bacterium FL481]
MPVRVLGPNASLPAPEEADAHGLVAIGGDLRPERLLAAYADGIFPWYEDGLPILWHSPDPRMVLLPRELHVGKSLRKCLRREPYQIRLDTSFERVIGACAAISRDGQNGTWITREMQSAYARLHRHGYAHSVEAWRGDELVGGLYGVSLGRVFCGESMFARTPDASKVAFVWLVQQLERWGVELVDCQVHTDHLARFGAREWPRQRFLATLRALVQMPTRRGVWAFDPGFRPNV